MYSGSMCGSGALTFAVWGYVISHQRPSANREVFTVELNPKILATLIGEPEPEIEKKIFEFTQPDTQSRTKAEEGRKLIRESQFLYRVVNGAHYDKIRSEHERREYQRQWIADKRSRKDQKDKEKRDVSTNGDTPSTVSTKAEAYLEAEAEAYKTTKLPTAKLSKSQRELADRIEAVLDGQWRNDAGKWVARIRDQHAKSLRVIAEVELATREQSISTTPAQYAEQIWKEFA